MARRLTSPAAAFALGLCIFNLAGCGTEGAPSPPSLRLPAPVTDLAAVRAGNQVTLSWTNPKRDTDKVAINGMITASICRSPAVGHGWEKCSTIHEMSVAPGARSTFVDNLPPELTSSAPFPLQYFVELKNRHGHSAGQSNAVVDLAGAAPTPVATLSAALHREGVALHWTEGDHAQAVRLYRKLVSVPQKPKDTGPFAAPKEAAEQTLLVDSDSGRALDKAVTYGETYEYRAQRIARVAVGGFNFELGGEISAPFRITFQDAFPPSVPTGLAAVATAGSETTPASIGLSWLPVTDRNLAGYIAYRREGDGGWQRISPEQPIIGPAFRDTQVTPGHTYRYAVTSVSLTGHESARSPEAEETVPTQ